MPLHFVHFEWLGRHVALQCAAVAMQWGTGKGERKKTGIREDGEEGRGRNLVARVRVWRGVRMPVDTDKIFSVNTPLALSSPDSMADGFIYWVFCGSRNSFAGDMNGIELPSWKKFWTGRIRKQSRMTVRWLVSYQRPWRTWKVQNQFINPHYRPLGSDRARGASILSHKGPCRVWMQ